MRSQIVSLLILFHLHISLPFEILSHSQSAQSMEPGQTMHLVCKSDNSWEFCLWKHTNMEKEVVRDCLMEWKRAKGGVSVQKCDDSLTDRISISGDYDSHECGLTITSLQLEDAGNWECEMEEYRFGDWVSGDKHTHAFDVDVRLRTTTTTTTTTSTTSTTSTTTTISTTTATLSTSTTELPDDEYENESAENTHLNEDKDLDEYGYDYPEHQEDDKMIDSNSTGGRSDIPIYDEYVEALAIEDEAQAGVSHGLIAGGVLVLMCLTVAAVGGGVFWNRKRKSIGVVTLHKIKDNSGASKSFLEDSEYHVSIMGEQEEPDDGN